MGLTALESGGTDSSAPINPSLPRERYVFKALVGKSADEVVTAVGKPDSVADSSGGGAVWVFHNRGIDPQTFKEGNVRLRFKEGLVSEVTFP
jgi:hypothetical protein